MSEYYSKEQLLESGRTTWFDMYDLEDFLPEVPTADVVPKSEVAIEIIQDIAKACAPHDHHLNSLDFEIGYITAMNKVLVQLEEIKKKYTEVENGTQ